MNVLSSILIPLGSEAPAETTPVSTATVLFIAVVLLLGAFFVGIVLITIGRRNASTTRRKANDSPELDPWSEAGKRAQPLSDRTADSEDHADDDDDDYETHRRDS